MRLVSALRENPVVLSGTAIVVSFCVIAVLADIIAPHDPWQYSQPFLPPNSLHLLGTNDVGQDILSELILGSRISLAIGLLAGVLAVTIGVIVGIVAGFRGGFVDNMLMGITDIVLVIPALPLTVLLAVYLGANMWMTVSVIGLVFWPSTARVIRSQVLSVRHSGYVESARALGASNVWLMLRHILPNVLPLVLGKFVLTVAAAVLMEASLSFLGLGDPTAKSWGMMLRYAYARGGFIRGLWWWYVPPGLCIGLFILGLMFVSFGVESRSDPRLKRALDR